MTHGFDRPLFVLPFDHRGSFETGMFGWKGALTAEQTAQIAEAKQVIYDGFKAAVAAGVPKEKAAILVDEQFGAAILRDAKAKVSPSLVLPRRVDKMSSNSSMAKTSPATSRHFSRHSPKSSLDITRRATRLSIGGKQNDSGGCQIICIATVEVFSCLSCWFRRKKSKWIESRETKRLTTWRFARGLWFTASKSFRTRT